MKEHQRFASPIITPTTKAELGRTWRRYFPFRNNKAAAYFRGGLYFDWKIYHGLLFLRGSEIATRHGLILVDTKYEFGKKDGKIYLIDEINTPDSSRIFYADKYQDNFEKESTPRFNCQKSLSGNGWWITVSREKPDRRSWNVWFICHQVSERYIELYEKDNWWKKFIKADISNVPERIENNCKAFLKITITRKENNNESYENFNW